MQTYTAYYRVSTQKQGNSGLGLEAQKAAVLKFVNCSDCIKGEFIEVESGKKNNRLKLLEAIQHSKKNGTKLIISKLDRLSRNSGFILTLKETGVDFVCADMPDANTLTIGIFAAMAQHEREQISSRTKAALGQKKVQGFKLGNPANFSQAGRLKGAEVRKLNAATHENNTRATLTAKTLKATGATLQQIADELNSAGFKTRRDKSFERITVRRLLERAAA